MKPVPERQLDPPEYEPRCCPVCGQECSVIYVDIYGYEVGCDECITKEDLW